MTNYYVSTPTGKNALDETFSSKRDAKWALLQMIIGAYISKRKEDKRKALRFLDYRIKKR